MADEKARIQSQCVQSLSPKKHECSELRALALGMWGAIAGVQGLPEFALPVATLELRQQQHWLRIYLAYLPSRVENVIKARLVREKSPGGSVCPVSWMRALLNVATVRFIRGQVFIGGLKNILLELQLTLLDLL